MKFKKPTTIMSEIEKGINEKISIKNKTTYFYYEFLRSFDKINGTIFCQKKNRPRSSWVWRAVCGRAGTSIWLSDPNEKKEVEGVTFPRNHYYLLEKLPQKTNLSSYAAKQ